MNPLVYYLAAQAAVFAVFGAWFIWRRYHKGHDWHCEMCGCPGIWRYRGSHTDYTLCGDERCLRQAEAENQWERENT